MKKTEEPKRMFKNPVLELLSRSGPKMMITFHLILASCLVYTGYQLTENPLVWKIAVYFFAGMATWTLAEYVMHRYVFHFINDNKFVKAFHFAMHGYHHEVPHDYNRLFMPPVPALLFLSLFFGIFYLIIGKAAWFFLPGFEIGYLLYSVVHYTVHTRVPKNKFLHSLWLHHANHHYKYPEKAFGVSSQLWDKVFNTMPKESQPK